MKVDADKSRYHEDPLATNEFNRQELRRARLLLRRLRFLEAQIRANGGLSASGANGGAAFAEWEVEALEWVLGPDGIAFLETSTGEKSA
jgi:hypothetical protein